MSRHVGVPKKFYRREGKKKPEQVVDQREPLGPKHFPFHLPASAAVWAIEFHCPDKLETAVEKKEKQKQFTDAVIS
jgi:hypothetical protein